MAKRTAKDDGGLGPHVNALLSIMRARPKRKRPLPVLVSVLEQTLPPDLSAFLTAWAEHEQGFIDVGEYTLEDDHITDRVPDANDAHRDDVVSIGRSPGGDVWVVDKKQSAKASKVSVTRLVHDEEFGDGAGYDGLEELLATMVSDARDGGTTTDLDEALVTKKKAGKSALEVVKVARSLPGKTASAATRAVVEKAGGAVDDLVGRYGVMFADPVAIVDDVTSQIVRVSPKITGQLCHYCQSPDGERALVASTDGVWEIDAATGRSTHLYEGDVPLSACYVGDRIACVLHHPKAYRLQLFKRTGKTVEADGPAINCGRLQSLTLAAGGRLIALASGESRKEVSYLLGVRDGELRMLASLRAIYQIWDAEPGGAIFVKDYKGDQHQVKGLDAALDAAFAKATPLVFK